MLAGQIPGIAVEDRQRTMGHDDARMSLYYSVCDVERRRAIPAGIMEQLPGHSAGSSGFPPAFSHLWLPHSGN